MRRLSLVNRNLHGRLRFSLGLYGTVLPFAFLVADCIGRMQIEVRCLEDVLLSDTRGLGLAALPYRLCRSHVTNAAFVIVVPFSTIQSFVFLFVPAQAGNGT